MTQRTQCVISLMAGDLRKRSSLDLIAKSVNLSSSRLRHVFKAETGTTPTQYLQTLRMQQAKQLLETTLLRVKEIALLVGTGGDSCLVREFKKTYGMSPARYRQHYQSQLGVIAAMETADSQINQ